MTCIVVRGRYPNGKEVYACVDPHAQQCEPKLGSIRFEAYLAPWRTLAEARAAMQAGGAVIISEKCR